MKNQISIIIPVYNSEKYIEKCLNSVLNQSYKNLEIICINDGSTDNSEEIIKKYKKIDKRIILFNKNNSGVSDTRNFGISKSSGNYIMFLDSDDYIEEKYIEELEKNLHDAEIIKSAYTEVNLDKEEKKSIYKNNKNDYIFDITYPKELENHLKTSEYNSSCCRLIKKSLIIENNIKFDSNLKYGEDMLFSFECYMNSKKTLYIKNYGYNYLINNTSAMKNMSIEALEKYFSDNLATTDIILKKHEMDLKNKKLLYLKTLVTFERTCYKLVKNYNYEMFLEIVRKEYKKYKFYINKITILKYGTIKNKISYLLLKFKLFKIYYLLKKQ